MFFIQVLQVDFLAEFQFTQVYTGLLFLPPDELELAHKARNRLETADRGVGDNIRREA